MSGRRSAAVVIAVLVGAIIAMAALSAHLAGQRDEATRELARSTRRLADLDSRITDLNHSSARLTAADPEPPSSTRPGGNHAAGRTARRPTPSSCRPAARSAPASRSSWIA
jgi:hypothetical protein